MIDFIGIGAQKSATSWIYSQLKKHKDICIPVKELHFFSRKRYEIKGIDWYENKFHMCKNTMKGEFSTSYLNTKGVAKKISDNYPNIKIIVSLRDPVKRAFSNYLNDIMSGDVSKELSFEEAIMSHPEYLEQGFYYEQIRQYLKYFKKENIHIILFENIKKNPQIVLEDLFKFLNVVQYKEEDLCKKNVSRIPKNASLERVMFIIAQFLNNGRTRWCYHLIKRSNLHNMIRKINTDNKKPRLSRLEYNKYIEQYANDMQSLAKEFKLDVSYWTF